MKGIEFPADLFPDGDRTAGVTGMPRIEPELARRLMLHAVASVAAILAIAYLLGQLRSTTLGYLFVPCVFAIVVQFAVRVMPIVNRERAVAMQAWQLRTGTRWIQRPGAGDPVHPANERALHELGLRPSTTGPLVVGRPWEGASRDVRIADAVYGSGRDANDVTMVAIGLDPRVAERYPGFSLTFGTRLGDMRSNIEMWLHRWPRIDMERSDRQSGVRVRAAEAQDHLAIWELFDPAFLVALEQHATAAHVESAGMLVLDGTLFAWCEGQFVEQGSASLLRDAAGAEQDPGRDVSHMPRFLALVRDVHSRLAAEHR